MNELEPIVISIKTEYARRIWNGTKTLECRIKRFPDTVQMDDKGHIKRRWVHIYESGRGRFETDAETGLQKRITGMCTLNYAFSIKPGNVTKETLGRINISEYELNRYLEGKDKAYLYKITEIWKHPKPLTIADVGLRAPPQFYSYVKNP